MSTRFFALLTRLGADKLANAAALGTKIEITHMAVGDGGGSLPTPHTTQAQLINERRRAAINVLSIDPKNTNQIIAEQVIPESEGGWWIREIGLFDKDGILIAVGNCAETYKPQLQEGSGRTQTLRMVLIVSSTDAVTLKIDPAVVLATREYVDDSIQKHANSRNHPDATLQEKGFVILSSAVDSNSETHAATPKAVKAAYDFANAANNNANGRVPSGRKVNGKALSEDIHLKASDIDAYNKTETDARVNDAKAQAKAANDNADGRVPAGRKVNGKALNADISLNSGDVGAYSKGETDIRVDEAKTLANARLEKNQNGADIPNKPQFVKNLGFIEQQTGHSATTVMSQAGATQAFALKQSNEVFKSGNHTIVSDNEYAYVELINDTGWRLSLETLPENEAFSGNIILRNASSEVISVIKIPRKFDTTFATLADLTGYQPAGNYATNAALSSVERKSVQAFRYSSIRVIKTDVNNWSPAVEGEFVIGIRTSFDGAGTWIITEVKVVKLQTFADGKWVNIQNA